MYFLLPTSFASKTPFDLTSTILNCKSYPLTTYRARLAAISGLMVDIMGLYQSISGTALDVTLKVISLRYLLSKIHIGGHYQ